MSSSVVSSDRHPLEETSAVSRHRHSRDSSRSGTSRHRSRSASRSPSRRRQKSSRSPSRDRRRDRSHTRRSREENGRQEPHRRRRRRNSSSESFSSSSSSELSDTDDSDDRRRKRRRSEKHKKPRKDKKSKKAQRKSDSTARDRDLRRSRSSSRDRKRHKSRKAEEPSYPGSDPSGGLTAEAHAAGGRSGSKSGEQQEETPEERHQRRLLKKQKKLERQAAEKQLFGYTNDENPFGDPNLTRPFVWKKKWQNLKDEGRLSAPVTKLELRQGQLEKRKEIEDLKRRRQLRDQELRETEEQRAQLQRDLDWAANVGWEEREEEFQRRQAGLRSRIRLREGRERSVDLFWRSLRGFLGLQRRRLAGEDAESDAAAIAAQKLSIIEDEEEVQRREEEDLANADSVEPLRLIWSLELEDLEQLVDDVREELSRLPPPAVSPSSSSAIPEGSSEGIGRQRSGSSASSSQISEDLDRLLDSVQESETRWADPVAVERQFWEAVDVCVADAEYKARQDSSSSNYHHSRSSGRYDDRSGRRPHQQQQQQQRRQPADNDNDYAFRDVHSSVRGPFRALLVGKTLAQLERLSAEVSEVLSRGASPEGPAIDFSYWEALQRVLRVYSARAYLQAFHEKLLINKLDWLRRRQTLEEVGLARPGLAAAVAGAAGAGGSAGGSLSAAEAAGQGEEQLQFADQPWSPRLYPLDTDVGEIEVVDEEEDVRLLQRQRSVALERLRRLPTSGVGVGAGASRMAVTTAAVAMAVDGRESGGSGAVAQPLGDGEAGFSVEVPTSDQAYLWQDKYRPRKPRYFNRVKTGYEWNKYNRTHYEKENPPPKIVQGYKFNIFYPDLIDSTKTPVYLLEPIPGEPDHCIIRFRAGAPYEDLAFKIVKKEWEYNRRRGFRCVFDKGVLQLYFNFKRYFYRR